MRKIILFMFVLFFVSCAEDNTLIYYEKGFFDGYLYGKKKIPESQEEIDKIFERSKRDYIDFRDRFNSLELK